MLYAYQPANTEKTTVSLTWTKFINNTSPKVEEDSAIIMSQNGANINISRSYFKDNATGGAGHLRGFWGKINVDKTTFVDSDADTGIFFTDSNTTSTQITVQDVTTVFDTTGGDVTDSVSSTKAYTDNGGYQHYESAIDPDDFDTINGVPFVNKSDGSTIGAYYAVSTDNTAPTVNTNETTSFTYLTDNTNAVDYNIRSIFTDAEDDALTITITESNTGIDYSAGIFTVNVGTETKLYTYTATATDWNNESVQATITINVSTPIVVDLSADDNDDISGAADQAAAITSAGADGLSLREAVKISNMFDGGNIIRIDPSVTIVDVDPNNTGDGSLIFTISSDVIIEGNGADTTTLQLTRPWRSFDITQPGDKPAINVTFKNMKLVGHNDGAGGIINQSQALIRITGAPVLDNVETEKWGSAIMPTLTLESCEVSDLLVDGKDGGAILASFANLEFNNTYFHDITSGKAQVLKGTQSTIAAYGCTFANLTGTSSWGGTIIMDGRTGSNGLVDGKNATNAFIATLTYNISNCTLAGNVAQSTDTTLLSLLGSVGTNSVTNSVEHNNTGFATINTELANASTSAESTGTRDGVKYYTDDVADAGADNAAGYALD